MSTTEPGAPSNGTSSSAVSSPERQNRGKGKNPVTSPDVSMEEEDEEEDGEEEDDDDDEEMDEDEEEDEEEAVEIDPSAILPSGRRTRGVRVDYASAEAHAKAGLKPGEEDDGDDEMK